MDDDILITYNNGYQGQLRAKDQPEGYFTAGTNLMALIKEQSLIDNPVVIRIGIDSHPTTGFRFYANDPQHSTYITIGKTGMYEACNIYITQADGLYIQTDSTSDTIIDYIIRRANN